MKPKIYYFKDHDIAPKNIDNHAFYIIEKLKQKGFEAYLVGGGVRDLLLKQVPKDFDISTSATPRQIKSIFKRALLIGRRFQLAHIRFGNKVLEVSTFRSGDVSSNKLLINQNIFGSSQEDSIRRDFTINALFYDPQKQIIIDYIGGVEDAKKKILKTIGDPKVRFTQDPVRMIRLLKFKARFDFEIEKNTLKALKFCKKDILNSSQARILEELLKMLQSGSSYKFFYLLKKHCLLDHLMPNFSNKIEKDDIFPLLKQLDIYILKHQKIQRSITLAILTFPTIYKQISDKYKKTEKPFHLGVLPKYIKKVIKETFSPFFYISKKLKIELTHILINQFRFTPPVRLKKKLHISKDPYLELSMIFFKLRTMDDKKLVNIYTLWNEKLIEKHKK